MVSRVGIVAILLVAGIAVPSSAARQPPIGTAMYVVRHDPRLCPSPRCGGYWATIANGARTKCSDGQRQTSCYVARAVDRHLRPRGGVPDGALVRGAIESQEFAGAGSLDVLVVFAVYAPAGNAMVSGGYYRLVDTGIRCIRAPCYSYRATQVNGSTRVTTSSVDLGAARAAPYETRAAEAALRTKNGLYVRGRFARTPDGGHVFRALRLYLRAP